MKQLRNNILLCCVSICINSEMMSQFFKALSQTEGINIFALHGASFVLYFQVFLAKKAPRMESETLFCRDSATV